MSVIFSAIVPGSVKIAESEKSRQGNSDVDGEDVYIAEFIAFVGNVKSADKECYP